MVFSLQYCIDGCDIFDNDDEILDDDDELPRVKGCCKRSGCISFLHLPSIVLQLP